MQERRLAILESFGLSGYQARAYLALLELGAAQAREVSERSHVPQGRVYDILEKLAQRGLAEVLPEAPRRYRAVPFEVFLEREMRLHKERVSSLERDRDELLGVMAPVQALAPSLERGEYVVMRGRKAVLERVTGLLAASQQDVLMVGTERTPDRLRAETAALGELATRGVRLRLLVPITRVNAEAVRECSKLGLEARHHNVPKEFSPGLHVVLADATRAMLYQHIPDDLHTTKGDDVGLFMEHPDIVRGVLALAESLWSLAIPAGERLDDLAHGHVGLATREQTILVVDDEPDIVQSLQELLAESLHGVHIRTAQSGAEGLELLRKETVDLIITDYKLPGMNGLEFLQEASKAAPGVQRILITAFPDLKVATQAINEAGVENFFIKPLEHAKMVEVVRSILQERRAHETRNRALARSMEMLRGLERRQAEESRPAIPPAE